MTFAAHLDACRASRAGRWSCACSRPQPRRPLAGVVEVGSWWITGSAGVAAAAGIAVLVRVGTVRVDLVGALGPDWEARIPPECGARKGHPPALRTHHGSVRPGPRIWATKWATGAGPDSQIAHPIAVPAAAPPLNSIPRPRQGDPRPGSRRARRRVDTSLCRSTTRPPTVDLATMNSWDERPFCPVRSGR